MCGSLCNATVWLASRIHIELRGVCVLMEGTYGWIFDMLVIVLHSVSEETGLNGAVLDSWTRLT